MEIHAPSAPGRLFRSSRGPPRSPACLAATFLLALALVRPSRAAAYGDGAAIPFLLLPADNPWNTPVDTLPLDADSAGFIAHMSPATGLHPDFGTVWEGARIGIPYVVVPGQQPKVAVRFPTCRRRERPGALPGALRRAGGGCRRPYADGDRHVLVLDADEQKLYELYRAYRQADGSWNAELGGRLRPDLQRAAARPDGPRRTRPACRSSPASRGTTRWSAEGVLDHALRFTVAPTQRSYGYPATHFASSSTDLDLPPMGLRVRLRADFDIGGFPALVQTILRGLKKYGMMVADNGSDWYVSGAPDSRWDDDALRALDRVTGGDFEVVDTRALVPGAFYVSLPATATAREGARWTRIGGFFDGAGALWTATVDYAAGGGAEALALTAGGDGQSGAFSSRHTWPDDGRRTVTVAVSSETARPASALVAVTVRNVAPSVAGGQGARVRAGTRLARTCSFRDPGADVWKGWVKYGDGTARRALRIRADKTFIFTPLRGAARPPLHRHAVRDGRRRRPRRGPLCSDGPLTAAGMCTRAVRSEAARADVGGEARRRLW